MYALETLQDYIHGLKFQGELSLLTLLDIKHN